MTSERTRTRVPFTLRLAVVVGAAALVLGLGGVAWILVEGDAPERVPGAGLHPRVRLAGGPAKEHLHVELSWPEGDVHVTQPARRLREGSDVWLLPSGPEVRSATLLVREGSPPSERVLVRRPVDLRPGTEVVVDLDRPEGREPTPPASR